MPYAVSELLLLLSIYLFYSIISIIIRLSQDQAFIDEIANSVNTEQTAADEVRAPDLVYSEQLLGKSQLFNDELN